MDPQEKQASSSNEPIDKVDGVNDTTTTPSDDAPDTIASAADEPSSDSYASDSDMNEGDSDVSTSVDDSEPEGSEDATPDASSDTNADSPMDTPNFDESSSDADMSATPDTTAASSASPAPDASSSPTEESVDSSPFSASADTSASTVAPAGSVVGGAASAPVIMGAPKKTKKPLVIGVIIAAIIVVLLGASAAAYYVVMNKPQNVLNAALANSFAGKVTSESFDGQMSVKPSDSSAYTMSFNGSASHSGAFTFTGKVDALVTTMNLDMRSTDGSTYYVRVSGLDGLSQLMQSTNDPTASLYAPIISGVNNQWIQVNQSMIQQLTGSTSNMSTKLSSSDLQKLGTYYKQNSFMTAEKSLPSDTIGGLSSYHYQVQVNKTKLEAFLNQAKSIHSLNITQDNITTINKDLAQVNFTKYPIDMWISKKTKLIDQLSFATTYSGSSMNIRYTVDSFNKPVNVVTPSNAKSLLSLVSGLFSGGSLDASSLQNSDSISL